MRSNRHHSKVSFFSGRTSCFKVFERFLRFPAFSFGLSVFMIRKRNSLQGLFIYITQVIFLKTKSYCLVSGLFRFWNFSSSIYQGVIWHCSINFARLGNILSVFVKMCSIKVDVLQVILVDNLTIGSGHTLSEILCIFLFLATNLYWFLSFHLAYWERICL